MVAMVVRLAACVLTIVTQQYHMVSPSIPCKVYRTGAGISVRLHRFTINNDACDAVFLSGTGATGMQLPPELLTRISRIHIPPA